MALYLVVKGVYDNVARQAIPGVLEAVGTDWHAFCWRHSCLSKIYFLILTEDGPLLTLFTKQFILEERGGAFGGAPLLASGAIALECETVSTATLLPCDQLSDR